MRDKLENEALRRIKEALKYYGFPEVALMHDVMAGGFQLKLAFEYDLVNNVENNIKVLVKSFEESGFVTDIKNRYESKIKNLEKIIQDLEKYKTFYELHKGAQK